MKPVSDALNNWIKTLITNHNHSRMKFIPMNDNKYDRGTSYVIEFGCVPHFQTKKEYTLIRICMSTYFMNKLNNNHIHTNIMITKPSVLRTDKPQDSSWFCINCDRLKCKDIVDFIEYFRKGFYKITEVYYRPNPLIAYNPKDYVEKFKEFNAYDYKQIMDFFDGCKSFLEKRNETNKRVKDAKKDFKKG